MAKLAVEVQTPHEATQELEYLLDEYESHMRLHKMKITRGTFETLIVGAAEILENVAKFRLSKAAEAIFVLKNRQIALLEAEQSAPGREVAYIAQAKRRFG